MAHEYINSFNSGELSPYIVGRADMDKYHSGCYKLENMYVLPYGGVERRSGTKYLGDAISEDVKLIPFNFTEDNSYVIEIGVHETSGGLIRVHDADGYTGVELTSPYDVEDLPYIKYRRIFDVIYFSCPTKPIYTLSRTKLSPLTFEITELDFIYPPLLEENADVDVLIETQPLPWLSGEEYLSGDQVQNGDLYYYTDTGVASATTFTSGDWLPLYQDSIYVTTDSTVILNANVPSGFDGTIFTESMEGSYFRMRHARTESRTADKGTLYNNDETSKEIFVGSAPYSISINNKSIPRLGISTVVLEGNAGAGWYTIQSFTSYGSDTYNATGALNERIRIRKTNAVASSTYNIGLDSNRRVSGSYTADGTSNALDVSFSDWQVNTGGTWNGTIELEKSIDGGVSWNTELIIGDTQGTDGQNFIVNSPAKEIANTYIRIKYTYESGTMKYNINNQSSYSEGLALLTDYISPTQMQATIINEFGSPAATYWWTEGAFSDRRGYPNAIDIYEDRLCFAGTSYDPSTIWMSIIGDYTNFQLGPNDDEGIKITPSTAEPTEWLLSRDKIFQGSRGGLNTIASVDDRSTITPSNIKSSEVSSYGSAPIQSIFANDVAVYFQRLAKKLRSIEYADTTQTFTSYDLSILASHITESGISEMHYQKTPDQIIWCLREDGILAGLTFERLEDVVGWHRHDYGGEIKSIAIRPSSGEDELWIAIKRDGGTYIEKSASREFSDDLLDAWYVDSGIETNLQVSKNFDLFSVGSAPDYDITISASNHGLSAGDFIRFSDTGVSELDHENFSVDYIDVDNFKLKSLDGSTYINYDALTTSPAPTAGSFIEVNNIWTGLDHLEGEIIQVEADGGYEGQYTVSGGQIETADYYNQTIIGLPYVSILQPMFVEPTSYPAVGKKKSISDVVIKFYKTVDGKVGTRNPKNRDDNVVLDTNIFKVDVSDSDKVNLDEYHDESVNLRVTTDTLGQSVTPFSGSRMIYINDDWSRLKDIYVVQNLPLPMTVLSMTVNVNVGSKV